MLWYQVLANRVHSVMQKVIIKQVVLLEKLGIIEMLKPVYEGHLLI